VKTSRLRFAGHMIRGPEDLPQKTEFLARPQEQGGKEDQHQKGRAQDREYWRDLCHQAETKFWL
jgi:hypothetical protein